MQLHSYIRGDWLSSGTDVIELRSAVDGNIVAKAISGGIDMREALSFARNVGGTNLRRLTFHQRADLLKKIAQLLSGHKEQLYKLSFHNGSTRSDSIIDVDGGIGTMFVYASKGRRELPNSTQILDGAAESLSKNGTFVGQHILAPLNGAAVHINAYNFPCWGLLEKFSTAFLAGVPVIVKPATITSYVAHALVQILIDSRLLPDGSLQFVIGSTGDLFDHLTGQDVVSFTGSTDTAQSLQRHPIIAKNAVRFIAERDSLNAAVLGPDAEPGGPEFNLYIKEIVKEMTVKAGQKCTAIRRALAPESRVSAVIEALRDQLEKIVVGNPELSNVRMGPVVSIEQRNAILAQLDKLKSEASLVVGDPNYVMVEGADKDLGAFLPPLLLHCQNPIAAKSVHSLEAFGPVCTVMGYDTIEQAKALVNRGEGSLVASFYTYDANIAEELVRSVSSFHGRLVLIDRDCANEQTGHGSAVPHMIHGGPGRAGGGEELGGIRGVHHYMQRTALQGSPRALTNITKCWVKGAPFVTKERHPFRYFFEELDLGQTFCSSSRTVTIEDIEHFANFTGDTFYAHMREDAIKDHPFFRSRVAHGYLLLSFAAGLFVDPDPGPVLANYGIDSLRFLKPVEPGTAISVTITVMQKTQRNQQFGEVRWYAELTTDTGELAATYEVLTLNAYRSS